MTTPRITHRMGGWYLTKPKGGADWSPSLIQAMAKSAIWWGVPEMILAKNWTPNETESAFTFEPPENKLGGQ